MSKLLDLLKLIRPVNSLMVGFAVVVGIAVTTPSSIISSSAVFGFLTGFFISSYSMVVNDFYDREVDRLNRIDRPIASGRIGLRESIIFSIILLSSGIFASLLISLTNFIIATFFAFIAWSYNFWGKKKMLIGNMMVAASVAIPYIYGGSSVERIDNLLLWFLALTSFLASTGREIIKTISDVEGDRVRDVDSIAIVLGSKKAAVLGSILFLSAVGSSFLPIITYQVGIIYSILIVLPNSLFIYISLKIFMNHSKDNAIRIKNLALIGMLIGMMVFIIGGIY